MPVVPIKTQPGMGRAFISHDDRNRNYRALDLLSGTVTLREKVWRRGFAYDQGRTPHCVAYEAKGKLNTAPFSAAESYYRRSRYSTDDFYAGAQAKDQWPGTDYDGTSAQGVLKHLSDLGIISEYRWCFGIHEVLATLSEIGPVGVGAWWRGGMWDPDPQTHLVSYSGSYSGGHQFEAIGIHPDEEEVEFMNSWGASWGDRGRFRMKFDQFALLLEDNADAHTLVTVN